MAAEDGSQQSITMEIVGDFQAPDRSRVNMSIDSNDASTKVGVITIEGTTYLKLPGINMWIIGTDLLTPYSDLFSFGAFSADFDAEVVAHFDSPMCD